MDVDRARNDLILSCRAKARRDAVVRKAMAGRARLGSPWRQAFGVSWPVHRSLGVSGQRSK